MTIPADAVARWQRQAPGAWVAARAWLTRHGITVIVTEAPGGRREPHPRTLDVLQRVRDFGYASVEGLAAPPDLHRRRYSTVGRGSALEVEPELTLADVDDIAERVAAFLREGQASAG